PARLSGGERKRPTRSRYADTPRGPRGDSVSHWRVLDARAGHRCQAGRTPWRFSSVERWPKTLTGKERDMPAYVIADLDVTDPAGFEEYRQVVPATIEKYGGRYLVRGGALETLEGDWPWKRVVVLEFPSLEQAKRWYNSEDYRDPKALRFKTAKTKVILVDGV